MKMGKDISIVIPTYNGGTAFSECLDMIRGQAYDGQVQLIVVDSGSTDETVDVAKRAEALVRTVDKTAFHHARTRNMAVPLAAFDRIIFMVQDAIPASMGWLSGMVRGLNEDDVAAAFAAQVPHADATPYARFETESVAAARRAWAGKGLQSMEAFTEMPYDQAYRSVGLDNVCAIYRKELLEKTPFPDVDFAEDMAWAVRASLLGYRVAYLPHVRVRHSHNRSPDYAFRRQIVNAYWVARIMGRVREDLSHLSLRDLIRVTGWVRSRLLRMAGEGPFGPQGFKGEDLLVDRLLKRYPLMDRMHVGEGLFVFRRFVRAGASRATGVAQQAGAEVERQMGVIEEHYPPQDGDEWRETLDQVAANVLGRIHGEAYAARVLKGSAPRPLEVFIRPFLSGV
jgi:GT2 family glycosyltransferase